MSIKITLGGSTKRTQRFLDKMTSNQFFLEINSLAQQGVTALQASTPKDSGSTAASWGYEVEITRDKTTITWTNTNSNEGVNIAIILQYGHGTGTGGYVSGIDYINPAIQPVFDQIADNVWKKVTMA